MRFRMIDGTEYRGRSFKEVVGEMAGDKLREPRSLTSYRKATAARVAEAYQVDIDPSSNANFIHSLEKAGLMELVG